jgi:electron transfer flavoprotein alpha subunit
MTETGVFVECKEGTIRKASLELLTKASEFGKVHAFLLGHEEIAEELSFYADRVTVTPGLGEYRWDTYTDALTQLITKYTPSILFGASTVTGKDLFPRLAARLKYAFIADATDITGEGEITIRKPLFGGRIISWTGFTPPALITFRPNSFAVSKRTSPGEIVKESLTPAKDDRLSVTSPTKDTAVKIDLQEADFIICGGRGMKGPEHFALLEEIASLMKGRVGASRAVVDAKWRDYDDQVGKSGKTVSPKLYIGCGISGALHHTMGMDTSKTIIAINKDPNAPFFNTADYGIVDDVFSILPLLKEELLKAKE